MLHQLRKRHRLGLSGGRDRAGGKAPGAGFDHEAVPGRGFPIQHCRDSQNPRPSSAGAGADGETEPHWVICTGANCPGVLSDTSCTLTGGGVFRDVVHPVQRAVAVVDGVVVGTVVFLLGSWLVQPQPVNSAAVRTRTSTRMAYFFMFLPPNESCFKRIISRMPGFTLVIIPSFLQLYKSKHFFFRFLQSGRFLYFLLQVSI